MSRRPGSAPGGAPAPRLAVGSRPAPRAARLLAPLVAALLLLLLAPHAARAGEVRPYDAPRVDPARERVPPIPDEYLTEVDGWIKFAYHPSARERVRALISHAAGIRAELQAELGAGVLPAVEVRVAAVQGEMARLSPAEPPGYATAVAYGQAHLVVMSLLAPLSADPPDLEEWLRHELAHIALDDALGPGAVPRWLHEGYAVRFAGENAALRAETLCVASLRDRTVGLLELEARFPADAPEASVAYAEAADFARFLLSGTHRARLREALGRVHDGEAFETALPAAYRASLPDLELAWRKDVARRYGFVPVLAGATLLWVVVAAGVLVRRVRRRGASARRVSRAELRTRASLPPRPSARPGPAGDPEDRLPRTLPPEPEVPRVEHGGRWYTLH